MTPDQLMALAQRLLYGCRDPVTGEPLYPGVSADACVEDVEAAARYLRACAESEPVATVRVHDTGRNAGIANRPLYLHPPESTRQPLTDDEIKRLAGTPAAIPGTFIHAIVRAVERHHRIESESK